MAIIKDALSALPAKPALLIAPILVAVVLTLYYRDQYNRCVEVRQMRAELNAYLQALGSATRFRLEDFTDFDWNKVRIVASVEPETISQNCPLDWNWPDGERDALLEEGKLAAVIFGLRGKVVRYLELNGDEVEFRGAEGNLAPADAVFRLARKSGGVILTLENR